MKVQVTNPVLNQEERTYLTSDYTSGTSLTVRNNEGFTTSWMVVVGEPGQEQTEYQVITGASGNTVITLDAALKFSHPKSTPVYLSQWDKISFEKKPTAGSYSEISGSPLPIEWDNSDLSSLIVVSGGQVTDTYKWRFYNSVLVTYSDYSDELVGTGLTRKKVGHLIIQVKRNPVAANIDDDIILDYFNDYQQDVVYPEIPKAWWFTKEGTAVATTAGSRSFNIDTNWSDFLGMKYLLYRYVSGTIDITYPLTWSPPAEFYNLKADTNQAQDDNAKYWTLLPPDSSSDKGYIYIHPIPSTANCYVKPVYYFELTALDSFGDDIVVPYSKGYIDYALYRIFDDIKSDTDNANKYNARVQRSVTYLKRLARRQLGQPELYRFRGTRGFSKMFGEGNSNSSESRELYW